MFDIEYKGGNSLVINTKKTTLITDPKVSLVGIKDISVKDAVELVTEDRFKVDDDTARLIINSPGEYEVGDFYVKGVPTLRHIDDPAGIMLATAYRIEIGDVKIAVLGNIAPKLTDEQLEAIGVVDLLIVPVGGGGYTLDATNAAAITRLIEPKIVIPIHYADSGLRYEVQQDELSVFEHELAAPVEKQTKYRLKSSSALPPQLTVVQLLRT